MNSIAIFSLLLSLILSGCSIPPFKPTAANKHVTLSIIIDNDVWVDGVKGSNDSNTTDAILGSTMNIGANWNKGTHQTGGIKNFTVHQGRFTDDEVVAL